MLLARLHGTSQCAGNQHRVVAKKVGGESRAGCSDGRAFERKWMDCRPNMGAPGHRLRRCSCNGHSAPTEIGGVTARLTAALATWRRGQNRLQALDAIIN